MNYERKAAQSLLERSAVFLFEFYVNKVTAMIKRVSPLGVRRPLDVLMI